MGEGCDRAHVEGSGLRSALESVGKERKRKEKKERKKR